MLVDWYLDQIKPMSLLLEAYLLFFKDRNYL